MDDYEAHLEICDTLREINEDEHDLRSGRVFPEFQFGAEQLPEAVVNLLNWDTFMYSRQYAAIHEERAMRHATRLLTYPVTIGSVLHELSPYNIRNRVTAEGLKSFSGKFIVQSSRLRDAVTDNHSSALFASPAEVRRRNRHQGS